ncbi:hypothetical protein [Streptococcus oralis]|uniref:hypothetical protein n=1 Tax=Streptococcus oralis TaxID=1303 RepID=UPI0020010B2A|nr:hypothetical protein [Streptococcus oralis]
MFKNTVEFIKRSTIDAVPEAVKSFKAEQSQKGLKYYWYLFLHDERIGEVSDMFAYYGGNKDTAKQKMSRLMKDSRTHLSESVLELLAKNMNLTVSELLWGDEENWKKLLPALFYLIVFESISTSDFKTIRDQQLKSNMLEVLKESVLFSSELAKKEIEADLSDGIVSFDIFDKNLFTVISRLYQKEVEEKFYRVFKEFFIEKKYYLKKLDNRIIDFAERVYEDVIFESKKTEDSLGIQVYQTSNLFLNADYREYRTSIIQKKSLNEVVLEKGQVLEHYLDEEQRMILEQVSKFVNGLDKIQRKQDERLGYRKNNKNLFKYGFDFVKFDEEYFKESEEKIEETMISTEQMTADLKKLDM